MELLEILFICNFISIVFIIYLFCKVRSQGKLLQFNDNTIETQSQVIADQKKHIDFLDLNVRNRNEIIERRMV